MTEITVNNNSTTVVPRGIVESKLKVNKHQMDILTILLAEIGKKSDVNENLVYTITNEDFSMLNQKSVRDSSEILRDYICENGKPEHSMRLIGFDIFMDDGSFEHYNWFSSIKYKDGIATFTLTPEVKHYLCEFKEIKGYRVFAQLRYLLPMKSVYSKRIYLMCKEFVGSGIRFCDTNWDLFIDKLQIPKSYNVYNIQRQILDKAIEEINELSDIIVDYSITTEKEKGGSRPTGIKFTIRKKDVENDIEVEEQDLTTKMVDMSAEELRANIEKMQALLAEKES